MIFTPPAWGLEMMAIPASAPIYEFLIKRDNCHLYQWSEEKPALVCAVSGQSYLMKTIAERVDALARSLGRELAWSPNTGSPWDKVIGIFSFNTLDFLIASWAVHRVGGICLLVHPTSSAAETKRHIELTKCRVLFTCRSLLSTANEVLSDSEIHDPRLYLLDLPEELGKTPPLPDQGQKTVAQLIREEEALPPLEALEWADGQGRDQWRI